MSEIKRSDINTSKLNFIFLNFNKMINKNNDNSINMLPTILLIGIKKFKNKLKKDIKIEP